MFHGKDHFVIAGFKILKEVKVDKNQKLHTCSKFVIEKLIFAAANTFSQCNWQSHWTFFGASSSKTRVKSVISPGLTVLITN